MFERNVVRRLLLRPVLGGHFPQPPTRYSQSRQLLKYSSNVQSVLQPSFWIGMIPKPLRGISGKAEKPKSKKWNPATFYIIIFLLIGSMSIQMVALRSEFSAFSRRADVRISLLQEVIEKVKNGEEVDVEEFLGTGDPRKEKKWEEVLQEIEKEDRLWNEAQRKRPRRGALTFDNDPSSTDDIVKASTVSVADKESARHKTKSNSPPGFY